MMLRGKFFFYFLLATLLIATLLFRETKGDSVEDHLEKCCGLGSDWASQKLRCETFTGPVSGVDENDQVACLETVQICCDKAFQEQSCKQGKADAKAGIACTRAETGSKRTPIGLGNYRHDCCEGCKLGILTGSSGKSCVFKKFSLGIPWDPAFTECCNEALTSTTQSSSSTSANTSLRVNSTTKKSTSDSHEFEEDDLIDLDSSTFKSDDLCQLMKGLLCSEICVPTPGSYYCECHEGSTLQADKRTCESNFTTTVSPTTSSIHLSRLSSSSPSNATAFKSTTLTTDEKSVPPIVAAKARSTRSAQSEDNELNFPCPSGFRYSPTTEACEDIDECASEKPKISCPPGTGCLNTNGSYVCVNDTDHRCELGYRWNSTVRRCDDVNECLEHIHKCLEDSEVCKNLEGSYECEIKCERGYTFNGYYGACLDINECNELTNICLHPDTICVNKPGSYECRRLRDYQLQLNESSQLANGSDDRRSGDYDGVYEGDIDECQVHQQPCAPGEVCRNTIGGYDCIPTMSCPRGFIQMNDTCQDENECELGIHSCTSYERCQNTNGSFTCEKPRPTRPPTTTEGPKIFCRKGFKPDLRTANCVDVDECIEGPGCRDHERCSNYQGGYDCFPLCSLGWYFDFHTKICRDVDECLLGHHNCRQRTHFCRNTNGSYICEPLTACESGYRRSQNGTCLDIDECLESLHTCSRESHRYCVNNEGGYECITRLPSCPRGFEYSLLTRQCEDLDECRLGLALCNSRINERCINLPGGYRCERVIPDVKAGKKPACPSGYSYDVFLRRCSDIDECVDGSHNCGEQKCYNLPGSFHCAQAIVPVLRKKTTSNADIRTTPGFGNCKIGSRYDPIRGGCVDVNECEELEDACSSNEECINSPGSFQCICLTGFRRDNLTQACVDINECQLQNDCLASQRCDNTIGSYTCVRFLSCGTGYTLNAATEICEDDDECVLGTHDCSNGYHCKNTIGSYRCIKDRKKDSTSTVKPTTRRTIRTTWASPTAAYTTSTTPRFTTSRFVTTNTPTTTTTTTTSTTTTTTTTPKPTTTSTVRTSTTTIKPTTTTTRKPTTLLMTTPRIIITPRRTTTTPRRTTSTARTTTTQRRMTTRYVPTTTTEDIPTVGTLITTTPIPKPTMIVRTKVICPNGFETGPVGQCIDIDECHRNWKICRHHRCINTIGSFRCEPRIICGVGFLPDPASNQCKDVDECAEGTHKCGTEQTCENRPGGYVCYCPPGHEVGNNHDCVDVNECERDPLGRNVCGSNSRCVNTPGSYHCLCDPGFDNDASGGCNDVDECRVNSGNCQQECYNTWGGHKCGCKFGYRLKSDNRTCQDVDECTELKINNLCIGICDNTPGSYVCRCPDGYKLADDGRTCKDIDECSNGSICKVGELCQNTRGGYRCNRIECPAGYIKDHQRKNRCIRESRYCPANDLACFQRPDHYTFNYIAIVSMYPIPVKTGEVELYTMRGAYILPGATVLFSLNFIKARAPPHVVTATESCFALRKPFPSQGVLVMVQSLQGPQDIELEFSMEIYTASGIFAGSAVSRIIIVVTQYEF